MCEQQWAAMSISLHQEGKVMLPVSEGPLLLLCRRLMPATERLLNFPCPVQAEVIVVEGSHDLHA